MYIHNF